jgi:hypothetical protein
MAGQLARLDVVGIDPAEISEMTFGNQETEIVAEVPSIQAISRANCCANAPMTQTMLSAEQLTSLANNPLLPLEDAITMSPLSIAARQKRGYLGSASSKVSALPVIFSTCSGQPSCADPRACSFCMKHHEQELPRQISWISINEELPTSKSFTPPTPHSSLFITSSTITK